MHKKKREEKRRAWRKMKKMRNRNEQNESRKSQSQVASDKRRKLAARDSQQSQGLQAQRTKKIFVGIRHAAFGRGLKVKSELHDRESYQFIQNIHLNNVSPAKLKITKFFVKNDAPYSGPQTSNPTRANKIVVRKGIAFFYII